jgi:hypothetical protein
MTDWARHRQHEGLAMGVENEDLQMEAFRPQPDQTSDNLR